MTEAQVKKEVEKLVNDSITPQETAEKVLAFLKENIVIKFWTE